MWWNSSTGCFRQQKYVQVQKAVRFMEENWCQCYETERYLLWAAQLHTSKDRRWMGKNSCQLPCCYPSKEPCFGQGQAEADEPEGPLAWFNASALTYFYYPCWIGGLVCFDLSSVSIINCTQRTNDCVHHHISGTEVREGVSEELLEVCPHVGKCAAGGWRLLNSPAIAQPCLLRQLGAGSSVYNSTPLGSAVGYLAHQSPGQCSLWAKCQHPAVQHCLWPLSCPAFPVWSLSGWAPGHWLRFH